MAESCMRGREREPWGGAKGRGFERFHTRACAQRLWTLVPSRDGRCAVSESVEGWSVEGWSGGNPHFYLAPVTYRGSTLLDLATR